MRYLAVLLKLVTIPAMEAVADKARSTDKTCKNLNLDTICYNIIYRRYISSVN